MAKIISVTAGMMDTIRWAAAALALVWDATIAGASVTLNDQINDQMTR
jgi:hypothetical protein